MCTLYFPPKTGDWEIVDPARAGFDPTKLEAAVAFVLENESVMDRDVQKALVEQRAFAEPPPLGDILGPTRSRADPHGLILRGGRVAASWGDTKRADITFSVAKSMLSICAGLLQDDHLIPDFDSRVRDLVDDGGFEPPHNDAITWRQLLQQTSEWQGELWSKPDTVDRNRDLSLTPAENITKGQMRDLSAPGGFWEYNDVRVNRLSLALLRVAGRPLPELFRERIMVPIGASSNWEWHGYNNSWIEVGGRRVQSVSGGSHWGGGVFMSSSDQARIGLLMQRVGVWEGQRLLSENYFHQAVEPCPLNQDYGLLWWLNRSGTRVPAAKRSGLYAVGFGSNIIWIEPELDLVAVVRWIEPNAFKGFTDRIVAALKN
ncbi:MAG: serine hydrolase [Rhodospirillaceae bacterium]|nr:serine hydrolase [Rhodospirillaceae bacterium]